MPGDDETKLVAPKPTRAPRKRAAKVEVESRDAEFAPFKRAPRKRTLKSPIVETVSVAEMKEGKEKATRRKAPTSISAERATKKNGRRQLIVVAVLLVLGVGSSAAVGFTDKGGIDINQLIAERNRKIESGELHESIIPVQNTNQAPDGGLIPLGDAAAPQVSGAASTTDATATSSATSTEEGNIPTPPEEIEVAPIEEAPVS